MKKKNTHTHNPKLGPRGVNFGETDNITNTKEDLRPGNVK
jgi:hypothetical protein